MKSMKRPGVNDGAAAGQEGSAASLALAKSFAHFAHPKGSDLLARTEDYYRWWQARNQADVWTYALAIQGRAGPEATFQTVQGRMCSGVNFATQDYLSLALHPCIHEAAIRALRDFGPHSAGSSALSGNSSLSLQLERALSELVQMPHVTLFPTGWAACFGTIVALIRPDDHVVIDHLAHASLQTGAHAATAKIRRFRHLDGTEAERHLREIRSTDSQNGILVVTEGLYSMDSDSPDLAFLQRLCRECYATLLVDVAHDLGATGPNGTGQLGAQGLLGQVDLVVGAFSKTFATNGGFVATHSPAVNQYIKAFGCSNTFSAALSPVQTAVAIEATRIIRSAEGEKLRTRLAQNVSMLRDAFAAAGICCLGSPSPLVMVPVGNEKVARLASRRNFAKGVFANLVEFLAVAVGAARFRLQVMANHTEEHVRAAAARVAKSIEEARDMVCKLRNARPTAASGGSP